MSRGTFPPASKMLLQREKDRAYNLHRQKMYNIKSQVDNSPPRQHAHLLLRLKQLQTEEEKKAKIDRENKILLKKMTQIMLSREDRKHKKLKNADLRSLNQPYRDRIRERICAENIQIAKRIEKAKPMYDTDKWEADYKHKQKLMEMWSKSTKDYYSPRDIKDDDSYDSDFESDDDTRKRTKLPPIGKRYNRGNDTDRSREGRQEHPTPDPELYMYYGLKKPRDSYSYDRDEGDKENKQNPTGDDDAHGNKQSGSDARQLFKVAKEMIPPHDAIIKSLAKKSYKQRMAIKDDFKEEYDLDLTSELKKGLGSDWFVLIDALLKERDGDNAETAELTKNLNVSDAVSLAKKLATLSNQELAALKEQYIKENSNSLEAEISKRHKDPIEMFLLTLAKGGKDESDEIDGKAAERDAQDLFEFGEGRWTSSNGKFLLLLEEKSPAHLRCVLALYKNKNKGKPASEAIAEECPSDYADVINAFITSSEQAAGEELETFHNNMNATNPAFVEMVVTKSETGMGGTKKAYKSKYGTDLVADFEAKNDHTTTSVLTAMINKKPSKKGKGSKKGGGQDDKSGKAAAGRGKTEAKQKDSPINTQTKKAATAPQKNEDKVSKQRADAQKNKDKTSKDKEEKDPNDDVKKLYDAMDGLGTNEDVIIDIIVNKSNAERQKLRKTYKERYKKDLIGDLKSELSGDFEEVILALLMTPLQYDAYCLHESISGAGTDETILIGIICSKKAAQINDIKKQYKKDYKTDLESDIRGDTSGDFEDMLVKILSGERDQSTDVDKAKAEKDAQTIHEEPSSKALKEILINNNRAQLQATEDAYKKLYNETLTDGIERVASGDSEDAFVAIVKANRNLVDFYTGRIHDAVKGLGTNDTQLIRIIVSRSEIDLSAIKGKYKELYGRTLSEDVEDDTSGDYKKTLLKVIDSH